MKPRHCCENCRRRHRRCVVRPGDKRCGACLETDIDCVFEPRFRFKPPQRAANKASRRRSSAGVEAGAAAGSFQFVANHTESLADDGGDRHQPADTQTRTHRRAASPRSASVQQGTAPTHQSHALTLSLAPLLLDPSSADWSHHDLPDFGADTTSQVQDSPSSPSLQRRNSDVPPQRAQQQQPTLASARHSGMSAQRSASGPGLEGSAYEERYPRPTISRMLGIATGEEADNDGSGNSGRPVSAPGPFSEEETWSGGRSLGFTQRQAYLFRLYILHLARSADVLDKTCHFASQVPRLALREPMVLNGILALSSRYDSLCKRSTNLESTYYHNRSIELLIEAFSKPPETWDVTLLTAVVIARLYEELDNERDSDFVHLAGTRNLLSHDAVARFVTDGGLGEAAAWVHLRQAIYVYLTQKRPVDMCLDNFKRSSAFRIHDDYSCGNQIVYYLARALQLFFPSPNAAAAAATAARECERSVPTPSSSSSVVVAAAAQGASPAASTASGSHYDAQQTEREWQDLERELAAWYENKPTSFTPVYYEPPNLEEGKAFPVIWMLDSIPMSGMQHYYCAQAILHLRQYNKPSLSAGFEAARAKRQTERTISSILCTLMGLALSNEHAFNGLYLPSHMLSLCGFILRHPVERQQTLKYLQHLTQELQWGTSAIIKGLKEQWAELDNFHGP